VLSPADVLKSWTAWVAAALALTAFVMLWVWWRAYFRRAAELRLSIAALLEAISIGVTSVSILLPTTGALLLYYLSQITADQLASAYPLLIALLCLGASLVVGIWNAFSLATQNPGGEQVTWRKDQIGYAIFFAAQCVFLFVGMIVILLFFAFTPFEISGLLKEP